MNEHIFFVVSFILFSYILFSGAWRSSVGGSYRFYRYFFCHKLERGTSNRAFLVLHFYFSIYLIYFLLYLLSVFFVFVFFIFYLLHYYCLLVGLFYSVFFTLFCLLTFFILSRFLLTRGLHCKLLFCGALVLEFSFTLFLLSCRLFRFVPFIPSFPII